MKTVSSATVTVAMAAALLALLSPISLQLGPVPLSLASFAVFLCAATLGEGRGALAVAVYLLLGAVGVPVFAGFTGGVQRLLSPTGGFLLGYLVLALAAGRIVRCRADSLLFWALAAAVGSCGLYICGTAWFSVATGVSLGKAAAVCVLPFLAGDAAKLAAAIAVGRPLRRALLRCRCL